MRYVYGYYARNAGVKNTPFTLTKEEFERMVLADCHYCGSPPQERKNSSTKRLTRVFNETIPCNGIDRKQPGLGYVASNCVPCCKTCNIAKHLMSVDDFKAWIARAYVHLWA